jgi:hypothetical protein
MHQTNRSKNTLRLEKQFGKQWVILVKKIAVYLKVSLIYTRALPLTGVYIRASSAFDQTEQPIRSKRMDGDQ